MSNQEIVDDIVQRATIELFDAYGVTLEVGASDHAIAPIAFAAVIGFSGETLRGTLLFAPSEAVLLASEQLPEDAARDWVGELANQLLGRVKNHLLRYDVEVFLTVPLVIRGQHISVETRGALGPHRFSCEAGGVSVWMDVDIPPGMVLVESAEPEVLPESGEAMLLF